MIGLDKITEKRYPFLKCVILIVLLRQYNFDSEKTIVYMTGVIQA